MSTTAEDSEISMIQFSMTTLGDIIAQVHKYSLQRLFRFLFLSCHFAQYVQIKFKRQIRASTFNAKLVSGIADTKPARDYTEDYTDLVTIVTSKATTP